MVYSHKRQCSPTSVGLTQTHPNNVFPEKHIEHLYQQWPVASAWTLVKCLLIWYSLRVN